MQLRDEGPYNWRSNDLKGLDAIFSSLQANLVHNIDPIPSLIGCP